jgi:hypothetical protein
VLDPEFGKKFIPDPDPGKIKGPNPGYLIWFRNTTSVTLYAFFQHEDFLPNSFNPVLLIVNPVFLLSLHQ